MGRFDELENKAVTGMLGGQFESSRQRLAADDQQPSRRCGGAGAIVSRERAGRDCFVVGRHGPEPAHFGGSDPAGAGQRAGETVGGQGRHLARRGGIVAGTTAAYVDRQADAQRSGAAAFEPHGDGDECAAVAGENGDERVGERPAARVERNTRSVDFVRAVSEDLGAESGGAGCAAVAGAAATSKCRRERE